MANKSYPKSKQIKPELDFETLLANLAVYERAWEESGREADRLFNIVGENPTEDEFHVMFDFTIPFKEKLAKVKALHRQVGA